jgi:nucleoside-diphosphate-sugar epimerase
MIPALEGTMRVLRAAADAGARRVVHTSSVAAVLSGVERLPGATFTETDWSNPDGELGVYAKSKTLAERAAWAFHAGLPESRRFELCALNPVYVLGPSLDVHPNASNEIIRKLVRRELPGLPRLYFPVVDVRDVAAAHLLAMTSPRAAGGRFILSAHEAWYAELAAILRTGGHRVPSFPIPDWVVHVMGWFSDRARSVRPGLGWEFHVPSEKARRMLGWQTRPLRQTVLDTASSILSAPTAAMPPTGRGRPRSSPP